MGILLLNVVRVVTVVFIGDVYVYVIMFVIVVVIFHADE